MAYNVDITENPGMSLATSMQKRNKRRVLAALGHQRERALGFPGPVPSDIRVREVPMSDRLNVDHVDELSQFPRTDDLRHGLVVR